MTSFQIIGYIAVFICSVVWLILLITGHTNAASNITGAISFVSLLISIFNPFDRRKNDNDRNDKPGGNNNVGNTYPSDGLNWNGNHKNKSNRDGFRAVALVITFVLLLITLGLALYPQIKDWFNAADSTNPNVEFRDEALDKAVHQAMGLDEGQPIPLSQARNISVLNLSEYSNSIKDLTGISGFINLETLYVQNNSVSNISDLKNLRSLRTLHIEENNIKDLRPLKELTSLRDLDLADNKIKSIDPLRDLTSLRMLDVSKNNISNINAVKNMTELNELYISFNIVKDISSIENLSKLYYLSMRDNNIENMDVLLYLPNLRILSICYNPLKSQGVILNLTGLEHLRISTNQFTGEQIDQLKSNINELVID